jgi:tRNA (guanine-N7-)-methyltransferase
VALSQKFPDNLSFGMEIRDKLCNYVGEKIKALRIEHPGQVNYMLIMGNEFSTTIFLSSE